MCMICVEYEKGKMSPLEGLRALKEITSETLEEKKHAEEVADKLWFDEWRLNVPQTD
jgi:hypothetical protein